jgi:hypothetical protein
MLLAKRTKNASRDTQTNDSNVKNPSGVPRSEAIECPMVIAVEQKTKQALPKPEVLRKNVIEQIQRLPDEGVAVLHEFAQELELRAAWQEFSQGMAQDWGAGLYDNLDQALTDARKALGGGLTA